MIGAIVVFFLLPFLDENKSKSPKFEFVRNILFVAFITNFILLGYLGGKAAEQPYIILSQIASIYHFTWALFSPL